MKIGGFQKQSLIDYPGYISSVIFTQGCNFRCDYCHNPELVLPEKFNEPISEDVVWDYLKKYGRLLDAVCITGGEPTMQKDLPDFVRKVRQLGLKVKLDSNGTHPKMLKQLFDANMLDFVAMDIKHQLNVESYSKIVGFDMNNNMFANILESVKIIRASGVDYEFRTTRIPSLHAENDIAMLKTQFGRNYKIQHFKFGEHIVNPKVFKEN